MTRQFISVFRATALLLDFTTFGIKPKVEIPFSFALPRNSKHPIKTPIA